MAVIAGRHLVSYQDRFGNRSAALARRSGVNYVYLIIAIVAEVMATSALKASNGLTRPRSVLVVAVGYSLAFYFLSLTIRTMPVGVAYGIWSAIGIVLIAAIGALWFHQPLDLPATIGLGLIISGVIVVNLFSQTLAP
jgi:small multidrug resistance pump